MSHRHLAFACLALALAGPAPAQIRLPGGVLPGGGLPAITNPLLQPVAPATAPVLDSLRATVPLQDLRLRTVRELLRRRGDLLEADPTGEPMLRGELLLLSPSAPTLAGALARGYTVRREEVLQGLDERSVVLAPPRGVPTAQALQNLRALDPALQVDFNHVFTASGVVGAGGAASTAAASASTPGSALANAHAGETANPWRVGLIDGGVDNTHPTLAPATTTAWGCDGQRLPSDHGTAVASLLLGTEAAGAHLYAADVYCGRAEGGSVGVVVQALAWLAREKVAVINISLVGPANAVLDRALQALLARGHLVVDAVGNDGPAAPPLYPASYPGVVGVTAVNDANVVLPEAARGPQVAFAAPGAKLQAARAGGRGFTAVRGTSFAAPLVAALLASALKSPDVLAAQQAVNTLAASATDLGAPGRDPVYGNGLVGPAQRAALAR